MSHLLQIPADVWEWLCRMEELHPCRRDDFTDWLYSEFFPNEDPENHVLEILDSNWEWAQQESGSPDPSDFLIGVLRQKMRGASA